MGPSAGLDAAEERKLLCHFQDRTQISLHFNRKSTPYTDVTDGAVLAPYFTPCNVTKGLLKLNTKDM
jgi:hypothetical protein